MTEKEKMTNKTKTKIIKGDLVLTKDTTFGPLQQGKERGNAE